MSPRRIISLPSLSKKERTFSSLSKETTGSLGGLYQARTRKDLLLSMLNFTCVKSIYIHIDIFLYFLFFFLRKYKDQRNLVVKLNIQAKRQFFMSMQSKTIDNDEKFWKTVKPLFSNKNPMSEKITLIEDARILSNDVEVAECFNEYFCNFTDSLDIDPLFK